MQSIETAEAPRPAGHYSQAVVHNGFVFVAGQLPIVPDQKEHRPGTVAQQTEQTLRNVEAILKAAGSGLDRVLSMTIYVSDIEHWGEVNTVYIRVMGANKPARAVVPVKDLHYGYALEIQCVAAVLGHRSEEHTMTTLVRLSCCSSLARRLSGAQTPATRADSVFNSSMVMIPMRDGVKLHTRIFTPRQSSGPLPILMVRTPYGINGYSSTAVERIYPEFLGDGYIFVFQDSRGKFKSEGEFVMMRAPRTNKSDPKSVDEGSDAWDTTDWLVKNLPNNNGRVGIFGISYPGLLTVDALLEPHPALKAASPQASPADQWIGDDFRHYGAFRLSYGLEYVAMMEAGKDVQPFDMDMYDTYDWYLKLGPLSNVNDRYFKGRMPTWNDFVKHPDYDPFWQRMGLRPYLKSVTVPTLHVAGWWDQEDFYGPITIYRDLEQLRQEQPELPRCRALESRRLAAPARRFVRPHRLGEQYLGVLSHQDPGSLLCTLPARQGDAGPPRGARLRGRQQCVEALRFLAAQGRRRDQEAVLRA